MEDSANKMAELASLLARHATQDGLSPTSIDNLLIIRSSQPNQRHPQIYQPGIAIGAQGKKTIYLEGKRYEHGVGNFMTTFVPMAVECNVVDASPDKPLLAAGIIIDLNRVTQLILKMDRFERTPIKLDEEDVSGIFSAPVQENLLDATIRLLRTLDDPCEAAILGDAMIDEIYFRVLSEERGGALKHMLQQQGQIHQIAKAVKHVHQHLDKPVSVDELAELANMSNSGFHKKFKQVMHLSPLQYAKSIKLNRAQSYIVDGKSVTEASYMVGYNNLAQFSREFKRHFGVLPSALSM